MKNINQVRVIIICLRTINIINYAQENTSLIDEQGAVKKKVVLVYNIKATQAK